MTAETVLSPWESVALAQNWYVPGNKPCTSSSYGGVSSPPKRTPFWKNSTRAMPLVLVAVAHRVRSAPALNAVPLTGLVRLTVGGELLGATLRTTMELTLEALRLSVAVAVMGYIP